MLCPNQEKGLFPSHVAVLVEGLGLTGELSGVEREPEPDDAGHRWPREGLSVLFCM